jgi:hypothetical protein
MQFRNSSVSFVVFLSGCEKIRSKSEVISDLIAHKPLPGSRNLRGQSRAQND